MKPLLSEALKKILCNKGSLGYALRTAGWGAWLTESRAGDSHCLCRVLATCRTATEGSKQTRSMEKSEHCGEREFPHL